MLKLTNYDNAEPVYVDPSAILSVVQAASRQYPDTPTPMEIGRRSVINIRGHGVFLVREDAEDIAGMMNNEHPRVAGGGG